MRAGKRSKGREQVWKEERKRRRRRRSLSCVPARSGSWNSPLGATFYSVTDGGSPRVPELSLMAAPEERNKVSGAAKRTGHCSK